MIVRAKTKFRLLILLASVVLLIGAAATVYGVRKRHMRQFYSARRVLGMTQYKNGEYANSVITLGQVVRREEYAQDAEVIYAFAESRKRVETPDGKYLRDAMTMLQRVLSIQPERADVKNELLDLYTQLGYNFEAIELAKKLLEKNPRDLEALRAKARGLAASQKSEEALAVCKEFISIAPLDLEIQVLSLEVLRDLRQRPQILDQVQDLLAKYPNDGRAELIAAFAFTFVEEIPETQRQQLTQLIKTRYPAQELPKILDPFHFSQIFGLQAAQRDLSDLIFVRYLVDQLDRTRLVAQSLAVLQKVDAQQESPWVRNQLVRRFWESGQFPQVIKRLEKLDLKGATPGEVEMLAMRGIAQARSDLQGPAAATSKTLASLKDDRFAQAWSTVINELFLKTDGNARQVIDSINFALELQRNNPYLRFFLGLAYLQMGERDAAYEAIAQVVKSRPLWQLPMIHRSRLRLEAGQKQSALEDASEAWLINPTLSAGSNLAIIAAANIDPSNAKANTELLEFVADIQKNAPGEEITLPLYVQLLVRTNQADKAKAVVSNCLSSKKLPGVSTLLRLASVSRASKLDLDGACLEAAEKSGLTPEVAFARATAMAEAGNSGGAVKYLQDCMKNSSGTDVSWRLALANFLEQIKDDRAAATWIALGDDPALKTNLLVQREVLAAASAQKDSAFLFRTVERIHTLTGERSIGWKMAHARLLLRDPASAASPALIKTLGDIVAAAPNNLDARALLASAYERSGNIPAAVEQLTAARKLEPTSKGLNLELARLYTAQLDFQRAREILESIRPDSLEPAQRRVAARLIGQQGDINRALGFMEGAQADAPALDRLYLAGLYRRAGQHTKAEAIYKSLLEKPDRLEVVMAAADYYASRGQDKLAMQTLANLEKLSLKPAEKDFAMAEYSARHGESDQALGHYLAVVETDPTKLNGWRALVNEYIRLGKADQAVEAARKALRALPADVGKPFQNVIDSAPALAALASEKTLIPLMIALMEPSPDGEVAAKALPVIVEAIKTKASAEAVSNSLRPIADGAPALAALQMLLVQNYISSGNPQEGAVIALRSQRISPASPEIARNTALAVLATGKFAQALSPAEQWRQLTPENPLPADLFIAELHLRLQDYVSALRQIQPYVETAKANPKDKNLVMVIAFRARALLMRGDDAAAADLIGPFLADQPQMRAIWRELSGFLPNVLAEKWFTRLAAATPADDVNENIDLAFAWHGLYAGRPRFKAGTNDPRHKQNAVAIIDHLAAIAPDHPIVVQSRAILAETDNRKGEAERGYRRALELDPNLAYSLNNLAMMLCDRGDLKEALSLAQRAVAADPTSASIRDTLADVQLKVKDYSKAQESLRAAVKLQPQEIKWRIKLAQAYDQAGQIDDLSKLLDEIELMTAGGNISDTDRETIRQLRSKLPAKTALR